MTFFKKGKTILEKAYPFPGNFAFSLVFEPMWERLKDGDKDIEEALAGWMWGSKNLV